MDLGQGFASFGQSVAGGIQDLQKQNDAYDQQLAVAQALSRLAINSQGQITQLPDPNDKSQKAAGSEGAQKEKLIPIINQKAFDAYTHNTFGKKQANTAALAAINRLGLQAYAHAIGESAIEQRMRLASQLGQQGLAGQIKQSRVENIQARTKATNVKIAQDMGLIPKIAPAPTGSAILQYQARQNKSRLDQSGKIGDQLFAAGVKDPTALLDPKAVQFGDEYNRGDRPIDDPKTKFAYVTGLDGTADAKKLDIGQYKRLFQRAQQWQDLQKPLPPTPSFNPQDMQTLLGTPTPQNKALFDKHYGQGSADTVINSQQAVPAASPTPDEQEPADQPEEPEPDVPTDNGE